MLTDDEAQDEWRTHSAELERKALATLQLWVERYEAGKIKPAALALVADVLYDTVIGIVPMPTADTIYAVKKEALADAQAKRTGT